MQVQTSCLFTNTVVLPAWLSTLWSARRNSLKLVFTGSYQIKSTCPPVQCGYWWGASECFWGEQGLLYGLLKLEFLGFTFFTNAVSVCTWLSRCNIQTFLIPLLRVCVVKQDFLWSCYFLWTVSWTINPEAPYRVKSMPASPRTCGWAW